MAVIGREEKDYGLIEDKDLTKESCPHWMSRKKVITERFTRTKPKEISEEMGVSQMYISWMETKDLERFRIYLKRHVNSMPFVSSQAGMVKILISKMRRQPGEHSVQQKHYRL